MKKDTPVPSLSGRLIIVTGASSGVGYATARTLAQSEGATVVAIARRRVYRIEALARQLGESRLLPLTADMADRAQAATVVTEVLERFGKIDGFVHAVNRALRHTALEVSDTEFDLTMQVNVKSALYGVQSVAPTLRRQGAGAVVIYNPTPRETAAFVASEAVYTASAHALSALTSGWSRQLADCGIAVREVAPSPEEETLTQTYVTHDHLLVEVLRDALLSGASPTLSPESPSRHHPVVLSERGWLALTQF